MENLKENAWEENTKEKGEVNTKKIERKNI